MAELPQDVKRAKHVLSLDPSHELTQIAEKLVADTPELMAMWQALESRRHPDDQDWVWAFLRQAADACNLPPYHYKSAADRRDLSNEITDLACRLARALRVNGLDAHLVQNEGKLFSGFFFYEDFGDSNRASIDTGGTSKLEVSVLVERIAERAQKKIADEPIPGKAGPNAHAIRFIRIIAARNKRWYGKPLNAVTATAANAIFGTTYQESDIHNLLNR